MKILDYVTVENIMPKKFCEDFIQLTHKQEWEKHHWTYSDERFNELSHKTKELDIQQSTVEMQDVLIPHIQKATEIYLKKFKEDGLIGSEDGPDIVWIVNEFSPPRINRYEVGTKMRKHYDHIHSLFADRKGIPILSFVGVFNDDYEGGKFIVRDKEFVLKTGDILMMPSIFLFPHEVTEITKGTRYSFVSWAF